MSGPDTFWQVIKTFLGLSLFSLGGGNTLLQEYHHLSVDTYHWITNRAPRKKSFFLALAAHKKCLSAKDNYTNSLQ